MDPTPIAFIALMLLGMYFLVIRPQRRRQAVHQKTVGALGPGARVMLASGVYATVTGVGDKTLRAEIAPGVEIEVLKQAVAEIIEPTPETVEPGPETVGTAAEAVQPTTTGGATVADAQDRREATLRPTQARGTDPDDPTTPPTA